MANNARNIVAGAALGACVGAFAAWALSRRAAESSGRSVALTEVNKSQVLSILWAVIGVIRLVMELDEG